MRDPNESETPQILGKPSDAITLLFIPLRQGPWIGSSHSFRASLSFLKAFVHFVLVRKFGSDNDTQ